MAKQVSMDFALDRQLERYLQAHPPTLNDIRCYSFKRDTSGLTFATVEIFIDSPEFDKFKEE